MEEKQLGGICIAARVRGESDRMLTLLCDDGFVYDVLARGALKPKYKLKFAAQLFSACNYFLCPSKAGYYILGGATFGDLFTLSLASYPEAYAAACVICESANKCVVGENKRMYAETVSALGELTVSEPEKAGLSVLRVLLASFVSNGLGITFPAGERGEIARSVLNAEAGNAYKIVADAKSVMNTVGFYGVRFAHQFGKLDSLGFFSAL